MCSSDLSLYCDAPDSPVRRSVRTVMDLIFERLTAWLSPLAPFTTDEAWSTRFPDGGLNAVRVIPERRPEWQNEAENKRWDKIRLLMRDVNNHLEHMRSQGDIGSSLEAAGHFAVDAATLQAFDGVIAEDVFRTSTAQLDLDDTVQGGPSCVPKSSGLAQGEKCDRCWKVLTEVDPVEKLCKRSSKVVANWGNK